MNTLSIKVQIDDLLDSLKKLSKDEKEIIWAFLEAELKKDEVSDSKTIYLASEKSLAQDWLKEEENKAWKDL